MSRSDPLLMLADIARLAFENPDVDEALVRAIHQHQVLATGRQPTLLQAREYIGHLASKLGAPGPHPEASGSGVNP